MLGKAIPMNFNPTVVYQLHILFVGAGPYIFCSPNYGFKMFQPVFDTYNKLQGNALKISGGENRALWSVPYFKGRLWVPGLLAKTFTNLDPFDKNSHPEHPFSMSCALCNNL